MVEQTRTPAEHYLELLKRTLVRWGEDEFIPIQEADVLGKSFIKQNLIRVLARRGIELVRRVEFDAKLRETGRDWPAEATTMIGMKRLNNIQFCVATVLREGVEGDLVETGVWRGGGSIFMRAALEAFGDKDRCVWCADSFEGLPKPDLEKYPQDKGVTWHLYSQLAVSLDNVQENFRKFDMLDERVKFLVGWFKDTLPSAPISKISVLRLDGDMYESTMDSLNALYSKISPGGFLIIDDFGIDEDTCRRAIHDFRDAHGIVEEIIDIDGFGAYWRLK
jgi:O-methyltransferase